MCDSTTSKPATDNNVVRSDRTGPSRPSRIDANLPDLTPPIVSAPGPRAVGTLDIPDRQRVRYGVRVLTDRNEDDPDELTARQRRLRRIEAYEASSYGQRARTVQRETRQRAAGLVKPAS